MFSNLQTKKVLFFWQNTIWDMKGWLHVPFPSLLTLSSSSIKQVYIQDSARSSVSAASSCGCCCIAGSIAVSGIHNQCVVTVLNSADVMTYVRTYVRVAAEERMEIDSAAAFLQVYYHLTILAWIHLSKWRRHPILPSCSLSLACQSRKIVLADFIALLI